MKKILSFAFLLITITIILLAIKFLLTSCESRERFNRPNLPEKLCCIGIIDIDNPDFRKISFEKSFQSEYVEELQDSLRDFSFTISSNHGEVFNYQSDSTIKNLTGFEIPHEIDFLKDETYHLNAKEKNLSQIFAESTVPGMPYEPKLISFKQEVTTGREQGCPENSTYKLAVIDFSFENDRSKDLYYAVFVEYITSYSFINDTILPIRFDVRESNSPGFFSDLIGLKMYQKNCYIDSLIKVPAFAYFIEGSKIPGNKCTVVLSTLWKDWRDYYWGLSWILKIRLLSIPKELFLYQKALYIYGRNSTDPFSEPIYINGNIKDGNGVFAICRSKDLAIQLKLP
jgi:hypothetical protein